MRYIGNKYKLLDCIDNLLKEKNLKVRGLTFCDIFTGTATVANEYSGFYKIIANDFLDYSFNMANGLLTLNGSTFSGLGFDPFEYFNSSDASDYKSGFCFNNFSPNGGRQYFSDSNAKKIDWIRDTIDQWYVDKKINLSEKSYLISCLIEAISKVSNVAGVYSAYLKIWDPRATKDLYLEPIETKQSEFDNVVYRRNADELISEIEGDILYIDPPYTPTQYNSQYHVLETISRNDNPKVHGVGAHRDNDCLSDWCVKGKVEYAFENMIAKAKFKHIIFSYSDKGIMSPKFIEMVLKRYAKEGTYTFKKINFVKYKSTRAVNREKELNEENKAHYEYLFYIEKKDEVNYSSPLNYTGGKFDALPLIKPNLPKQNISTFYDLFGGGATVSLNNNAKKVVYNDLNYHLANLLNYLAKTDYFELYKKITSNIKKYGLEKENKIAYESLRDDYNVTKDNILLYLLLCYGFEHQLRFNSKQEFNNPCGNSSFNEDLLEKLINFKIRCDEIDISFEACSFEIYSDAIKKDDFVYLDPPYLDNLGVYNDGKRGFVGWDENEQNKLFSFIEDLNKRNIRFMLSNYYEHTKGENSNLIEWAKKNNFRIIIDDKVTKRNRQDRVEMIIINY